MAKTLKELIEQGLVFPALLPKKNDFLFTPKVSEVRASIPEEGNSRKEFLERFHARPISEKLELVDLTRLDTLEGYYTLNLMGHDYGGKASAMWNALYAFFDLPIKNLMLVGDVKKVEEIVTALKADPKYLGGGASVGFKEIILPFLDEKFPSHIRSSNALVNANGRLIGYNTDAEGLLQSVEDKLQPFGKKVQGNRFVVVGAGAVGQEFIPTLANVNPAYIIIANRTIEKAKELAAYTKNRYPNVSIKVVGENDLSSLFSEENNFAAIINTTDKGGDAYPNNSMFYGSSPDSNKMARKVINLIQKRNPGIVYVDAVLPSKSNSNSLQLLLGQKVDPQYIEDGRPMVFNQGVRLLKWMQDQHPEIYEKFNISQQQAFQIFKNSEN